MTEAWLKHMPVVAILRGVTPDEVVAVARTLHDAGIRAIEVPLNSPEPLRSIERLVQTFGDDCLVGAGTVLSPDKVDAVRAVGGQLIVSPNIDVSVIARTVALDMVSMPGFSTGTEAFAAIGAGARHLKLFPASSHAPGHVKALKAVLPADVAVYAVGGVTAANLQPWVDAGVTGFGSGGDLYKPGVDLGQMADRAAGLVAAVRAALKLS
ncbi:MULTISPECIES: 2-dehydro-3-deoxy-6-phosphogalactonate aldolase [Nitrospirillum]|uniref:2-keto-3-deoxy-phosphogalactonate aldolase n=1 Tax=Nitrospirillum amazonense TaxID=28077 RepID=A0A560FXD8_9PROT|nr:2-dehydro-3-deoxy-6-phosphogalactonate aldolase [Nitrospirillum amazonense]MEC4590421.1 2-dehydro-3-deoxy-6-phosphogalactonate aldolase [Nitrospirillum amazonense]TWB26288.1 2-keto-3-deoxy-phosphogalactonate aldolase [Nitrospirillum amazonense]